MSRTITRRGALVLLAGAVPGAAWAQFNRDVPARMSLLAGGAGDNGKLVAGVKLALDTGWLTYWRDPGEAGVPPAFDFSGSDNLADATVLYPAPARLDEGDGVVFGYERQVVFPVRVTARDPGRPVTLAVALRYGVCRQICIPAEGQGRITLGPTAPPADAAILERALARVPRRVAGGKAISDWSLGADAGSIAFTAHLPGVRHAVVEGPEEWGVAVPKIERLDDDAIRCTAAVRRPPAAGQRTAALTVTIVAETDAIEEARRLDGSLASF